MIVDEVQTGLLRTGSFYASDGVGLSPDIITLAKPLGGGLPLSAVLLPAKINDLIHPGDHGTTFGGGPVTTAVSLKMWETLTRPAFQKHVQQMSQVLDERLRALQSRHAVVGELRGKGMLRGFEYKGGEVLDLVTRIRERGLLVLRAGVNVLRIAPPLVIEEALQ